MASGYRPNRMSVVASGIFHNDLEGIVGNLAFPEVDAKYKLAEEKAMYVGGMWSCGIFMTF